MCRTYQGKDIDELSKQVTAALQRLVFVKSSFKLHTVCIRSHRGYRRVSVGAKQGGKFISSKLCSNHVLEIACFSSGTTATE